MSDFPMQVARELSDEEAAELATRCFDADQMLRAGLLESRQGLWKAAEAAYTLTEEQGWYALGYESFGDYLADPGITLTRRTFQRLHRAHEEMIVRRQLPPATVTDLDLTKVDIVMDRVRAGKVPIQDALDDVRELGARDLRIKYKGEPPPKYEGPAIDVDAANLAAEGDFPEEEETARANVGANGASGPDSPYNPFADEPALNTQAGDIGQVDALTEFAEAALRYLLWIANEIAPVEKRKMSQERRDELDRILALQWVVEL